MEKSTASNGPWPTSQHVAAQLATPHAEAAFVHAFCRDRSLLLGVEGYALTSLEVALATPPRPGDVVPVAPPPVPPTAVAA